MKEQVANRLRLALKRRERSIRSFQRALKDQGVHGSSYASVYQYVQGRTSPPLEFLEGAANELAVRVSWLVSGEGLMGVEDEERDLEEELASQLGERHPWLGAMPRWNLWQFRDVLVQYSLQVPNGLFLDNEQLLELADDLAFLVTLPLRSWGFQEPYLLAGEKSEHDQLQAAIFAPYFRLMIDVLSLVMKQPTMSGGDGLDERPGSLIPSLRRALEQGLPEPPASELEKAQAAQRALDQIFAEEDESWQSLPRSRKRGRRNAGATDAPRPPEEASPMTGE